MKTAKQINDPQTGEVSLAEHFTARRELDPIAQSFIELMESWGCRFVDDPAGKTKKPCKRKGPKRRS